jgi:hypothetical protein
MMRIHNGNILRRHDDDVPKTREKKGSVNGMPVDKVMISCGTLMAVSSTGVWRLTAVTKDVTIQPEDSR